MDMSLDRAVSSYAENLEKLEVAIPTFHFVLGSGLGGALSKVQSDFISRNFEECGRVSFDSVEGLCSATAPDHLGAYLFYRHKKTAKTICFQAGRLHGYEGHTARKVVTTVLVAALNGTKNFVVTNAAGSLTKDFRPGSVMIIRDHVNLTGQNPLAGENLSLSGRGPVGPRFVDLQGAYDRVLSDRLDENFLRQNLVVHEGTYLGLLGPSFETPAEIKLFGHWGLHAVGMSTVWEVIQLKHVGARVAGVSLITNFGCGLTEEKIDHLNIIKSTEKAAQAVVSGLFSFVDEQLCEGVV